MAPGHEPQVDADAEIEAEQRFVDRAYARLDRARRAYRQRQRVVESRGGQEDSPQSRTERDAQAAHYGDQAARLEGIEERLVFGRVDGRERRTFYVGRIGVRDEDGERLLIDWRAPAARPFYEATAVAPQGVVRRRHIATRARRVTSLEDELLDAGAARGGRLVLQGEGALMSALSEAREGHMADIVATIQAEQDVVIRAPDQGLLVVQGGPGTGKTAVALHRAAYLLYAERERLERSGVLIVGPSPVFLRYIERVLPSLGETGVVSLTLGDLVPGVHARALEPEDVAEAKGSLAWVETIRRAVRSLERVPEAVQTLRAGSGSVVLRPEDVARARARARRSGRPHNVAREGFALELVRLLTDRMLGQDRSDVERRAWTEQDVRDSRDVRRAINLCWMPTSARTLLDRLYARPAFLASVSAGLSARERELVARPAGQPLTVSDVPLLDELEEQLGTSPVLENRGREQSRRTREDEVRRAQEAIEGQGIGGGIVTARMLADQARGEVQTAPLAERAARDRAWTYGHVVVDEAQELSPMAWHALLRRCPSRSFTVVGDLDQRRGHRRPATWGEALGPAARALAHEYRLTISYRTPRSITQLAEAAMAGAGSPVRYPVRPARDLPGAVASTRADLRPGPAAPPGDDPLWDVVRRAQAREEAELDRAVGAGRGRIAVIVGHERALAWGADLEGRAALDRRVSLLGAPGAKGLEFDTVVLVEPSELLADGPGDLFVAMTRPTRRLHIVHAAPLPVGMHVTDEMVVAPATPAPGSGTMGT